MGVADDTFDQRQPLLEGEARRAVTPSDFQHFESGSSPDADPALESSGGKRQLSEWSEQQHVVLQPDISSNQFDVFSLVSVNEIRAAASKDPYPSWIYGALITPADSQSGIDQGPNEFVHLPHLPLLQGLQAEEIQGLLINYVSRHFCWGSRPARNWIIQKVEDCNSYFGSLESFVEERDMLEVTEPYTGEFIDGKKPGRMTGPWEVDMRTEFPLLFTQKKTVQVPVPNSEFVARCADCSGKGEIPCPSGSNHSGKALVCLVCHGRGLIAHMDGSDTKYVVSWN